MEIGTEISKKIRAAIKGKLQELGAYIDEELPDYIMVMVANKKTSQQMAEDLSLFLGNNTIKFTAWLHGVLEKLRSVAVEPTSVNDQIPSDSITAAGRGRSSSLGGQDISAGELKLLTVSSCNPERIEARVSSSAHESSSRRGHLEKSSSRLTSTVKPLVEGLSSEAVIDIKPEMDDDFIGEDPQEVRAHQGRTRSRASRPTAEVYRPGQGKLSTSGFGGALSSHSRQQESRSSRSSRGGTSKQEEISRKRKAPVASSVVRVSRAADDNSDDVEEDDEEDEDFNHGGRGVSSRVSLPSKPERKPTLPPAKQANRNLILKAISEAQDSITKTTSFPTIPPKQTVPVAPRARLASSDEMTAAIQLVQKHLNSLAPRVQTYTNTGQSPPRPQAPSRSLSSRLQLDGRERIHDLAGMDVSASNEEKPFDTRSFIMNRPQLEESQTRAQQQLQLKGDAHSVVPRTVQASKDTVDSASPKFIVTLDGIPSPMGNLEDCDMELDDVRPPIKITEAIIQANRAPKVSVLQRLQGVVTSLDDNEMEADMEGEDTVPVKKQKVMERCKFWPACKSGDECLYHHPTTQCKTFPNCRFGDKCLFIHPSCKYDAKCTKSDCPFTHISRRGTVAVPHKPAVQPPQTASVCHFFPDCKKMDCPFYHPKPCRFAAQCKRSGCTFYHPTTAVPPRHALKWTKAQSS